MSNNAIADPDGENLPSSLATSLTGRWDLETITNINGVRTSPNTANSSIPAYLGGAIAADDSGMVSKATRMSAMNQYLKADPTIIAGKTSFSISLWFRFEKDYLQNKLGSLNTVMFAFNDVLDATPQFQLHAYKALSEQSTQKLIFSHYSNTILQPDLVGEIPLSAPLDDGNWQHLTLTKSSGTIRIYRNAQQIMTGGVHSGTWGNGANGYLCFGALAPAAMQNDTNFRGSMDRLRTWSRAITQSEITALHHQDIDRDGLWDITEGATRYSDYQNTIIYHPDPADPTAPQPSQTGYARSPFLYSSGTLDFDQDELNDLAEQTTGTRLTKPDTDDDNLTDGFEITNLFNPLNAYSLGINGPRDDLGDPDSDGLLTLTEYFNGSNPRNSNSDGDATHDAAEVAQGSDPANAADSGAPPTDSPVQVPFHIFGDYTAWEATIKGKGPNDTRTRRFRMSAHNVAANQTLDLLRGNAYELNLRYIRSKPGESVPWYCWETSIDGKNSSAFTVADHWIVDNNSALLAEHTHSHGTNQVAEKTVNILAVEAAVDSDRNGEIEFGKDKTTAEIPYEFWVNHDRDIGCTVDGDDWEEDDVDGNITPETWDIFEPGLKWRRDLEDLTRVWIDMKGLESILNTHDANIKLHARIESTEGTPEITLFQPVETDGERKYLTDESTGYNQTQSYYGDELCTVPRTPEGIEIPRRAWENLPADKAIHLLFEGKFTGKGKLIFEFRKDGQIIVPMPPVFLHLKKVEDMYETWSVGDAEYQGVDYGIWPAAAATQTTGMDLPAPQTNEEKDYILFVHGWNMEPWEKSAYASTMFKRLWHQGYKGRFGAFRWPTFWFASPIPPLDHFNASEQRAWNSAAPLKALIAGRAAIFNITASKVRLYAHSMGNIVASECLRQFGPEGAPVHTYIAAQAAISSHVFDRTTTPWAALDPLEMPNVYGYYWQQNAADWPPQWQTDSRPSYMDS